MLVYKAVCDCCGKEFEPHKTFTVEVKRTSFPNDKHYMMSNAMAQVNLVYPKDYIVCKECLGKFPIAVIDS